MQTRNREFKLEVQPNIACCFAPAGRDVYSLAVLFFTPELRRSAIAFACLGNRSVAGVSLLKERDSLGCMLVSYKHLAPPGAKTNSTIALVS